MYRKPRRSTSRSEGLCSTTQVLIECRPRSRNARDRNLEPTKVPKPRLRRDFSPVAPQNVAVLKTRSTLFRPAIPVGLSWRSKQTLRKCVSRCAMILSSGIGGILDGRVATAKEDIVQPDQHRIWPRRHEGKLPACTVCRIGNGRDARLVEVG